MAKIGIGAIGVGGRLCGLLNDLLKRHGDECEVRALADEAPEALAAARQAYGQSLPAFADYHELLKVPGVDWVMIGSKNYLHRDHCVAAFAAGKHVFCEKPMAISIAECDDIRRAHRQAGTLFATGFVLRHAPLYVALRRLLTDGALGRLISIEANENLAPDHGGYIMRNWRRFRRYNGPHLLEKCSHDIDLINWMVDSLASRVASFGGLDIFIPANRPIADRLSRPDDQPPLYCSWPAWEDVHPFDSEKDVEDNQVAILEYRNRVRVTFLTNCCNAFPQRRMLLSGLEGTAEADLVTGQLRFQRIGRQTKPENVDIGALGGHGGADQIIVDDLVHAMRTNEPPKASGEEAFKSAITCLAIDEALYAGKVVDLEPYWRRFGLAPA